MEVDRADILNHLIRPFAAIGLSGLKRRLQSEDPLAGIVVHFRAQMGTAGQGHGLYS